MIKSRSAERSRFRRIVARFIESLTDAEGYRDKNFKSLARISCSLHEVAERCSGGCLCYEMLDGVRARAFRLDFAADILALMDRFDRDWMRIVSIDLCCVEAGQLSSVRIAAERDRLRKQLLRAGITMAIGGIEASFAARRNEWKLHAHLMIFDVTDHQIDKLEESCYRRGLKRPFESQKVNDPVDQVTYLLKFSTGHRPGSGRKPKMYPLPKPALRELAAWWSGRKFEDFVFLLGFRRRRSGIEQTPRRSPIRKHVDKQQSIRGDMATWRHAERACHRES